RSTRDWSSDVCSSDLKPQGSAADVYNHVREEYLKRFGLAVTEPLGFDNTFAIVIRGEDARRLHLHTISEAARYTPQWRAGFGYEIGRASCRERAENWV